MSVPIQQIGRCAIDDKIDTKHKDKINKLFNNIEYRENLADISRVSIMNALKEGTSIIEIVTLYKDLLIKYPNVFYEAIIYLTEDAWSPFSYMKDKYNIPGYQTGVFALYQVGPATRDSKCNFLLDYITSISTKLGCESIPFIGIFFLLPFYIMFTLFCLFRSISKKNSTSISFLLPLLFLSFTAIVGPCVLFRYYLYLIYALPLISYFTFSSKYNN